MFDHGIWGEVLGDSGEQWRGVQVSLPLYNCLPRALQNALGRMKFVDLKSVKHVKFIYMGIYFIRLYGFQKTYISKSSLNGTLWGTLPEIIRY